MICRVVVILYLLPACAWAAEVSGLYEAEVQVFSQKREERATAMVSALAEVLTKVSGRRDANLIRGVAQATRQPAKFLQQYRYRDLTEAERVALFPPGLETEDAAAAHESQKDAQMVYFQFDKAAVDKVLRDNNLTVWGATRPATLVWLAVQDETERYLVGSEAEEPVRQMLTREAQRRGMSLLLPLMDLEDQIALKFADVWAGFREPLLKASARYRTEAILVGRLYRGVGGEWQGQWSLLEGEQSRSWTSDGVLMAEVVDQGVAGAIEILAAHYAPVAGQQQEGLLPMVITGVRNLEDYSRVSKYLQSLQQVSRVQLAKVEADRLSFDLEIKGGAEAVAQTIALGNVLVSQPAPAGGDVLTWMQTQVYQLLP